MSDAARLFRSLPAVDDLLERPATRIHLEDWPRHVVVDSLRAALDAARRRIRSDLASVPQTPEGVSVAWLDSLVAEQLRALDAPSLRPVLNGTGVVLHTNLGRAPLSEAVFDEIKEVLTGYSNLEFDLASGKRGKRHVHAERLLAYLLGVEAATVVNNCASAVMLTLTALATNREVIVSRGELIEIGGSFRLPDVMKSAGCRLVEVGTTNRTRISDYADAITDETAVLLKAHRSNFEIVGFTESVSNGELAALAAERGVVSALDIGHGLFIDLAASGVGKEEPVGTGIAEGLDVIMFSGDKLMGGPQAGIIAGKREVIDKIRRHPLMRALRVDKFVYAVLEATLRRLVHGRARDIPTLDMILTDASTLETRAQELKALLAERGSADRATITVVAVTGKVGGGTMPLVELPSFAVGILPASGSAASLDGRLRSGTPALAARISDNQLLLDVRTLPYSRFSDVADVVTRALHELTG